MARERVDEEDVVSVAAVDGCGTRLGIFDQDPVVAGTEIDDQLFEADILDASFNVAVADLLRASHAEAGNPVCRDAQLSRGQLFDGRHVIRVVQEEEIGFFVLVHEKVGVGALERVLAR